MGCYDLSHQDQKRASVSSSSSSLGLDLANLIEDGPSLGPFSSKVALTRTQSLTFIQVDFGLLASELGFTDTSSGISI